MTAPPIAMISNPLSERNRSGMADIEACLRGRRGIEHIRFEPGMDLQAVLANLAARECGLLILNSGDGLVHGVLGALFLGAAFDQPPPLALLPRGMTNMTAADVGLGGRDAATLARLLDIAAAGKVDDHLVRRRVLKVDYDPALPGERGMCFGAAGIYDGIHLCKANVHTLGLTGSWANTATLLMVLGRALIRGVESVGIGGAEVGVTVDGVREGSRPRAMVMATTLDRLVLNSRPFWNNGDGPIHFTVVDHPAVGLVGHSRQLLYGGKTRDLPDPPFRSSAAGRVELDLDTPFTIDGEFFQAAPGVPVVITAAEEVRYVKLRPMSVDADLAAIVAVELATPAPAAVVAIATATRERHGLGVCAVLFYGSCLRDGYHEGLLVDLYLLVDDYAAVHRSLAMRWLNRLIPPNVYYAETGHDGGVVRAKYALVSLPQFERRVGLGTRNPYFWARFAQPTGLVWSRDAATDLRVRSALVQAILTTDRAVRPLLADPGDALAFWARAFAESYRTELRAEKPHRAAAIVSREAGRYRRVTGALGTRAPDGDAATAARRWWLRRVEGKALSVLRLIKASFTFAGGADYIAWKISRHAGVPVEFSAWERRHPILAAPLVLWRLTRQGVVR